MRKILLGLAILAVIPVSAFIIYRWHEINEKAWWKWKAESLAISEHIYRQGKLEGLSNEKIDSIIRDSIYIAGLRKPGFCPYCEIRNIIK